MKKILKITLFSLTPLILLIVIGVSILVNTIDPNNYKDKISSAIQNATGRQLVIFGRIEWSVFPWLGLKVNNASLSNAPGFGEQPFLKLSHSNVSIKLLPLLWKQIQLVDITLENPEINLMRNSAGVTNWNDLIKTKATSTSDNTVSTTPSSKNNFSIAVNNIRINNGKINWTDRRNQQNIQFSNLNLNAKNIAFGKTFSINFKGKMKNLAQQKEVNISFFSNILATQNLNKIDLKDWMLKINNFQANGSLLVDNRTDLSDIKGQINISNFNPLNLIKSLGIALPTIQNQQALKSLSIQSKFTGTKNSLDINSLKIKLDDTELNGTATINNFNMPKVSFLLQVNQINLDNYLSQKTASSKQATNTASTDSDDGFDAEVKPSKFESLRKLTLRGTVKLDKLTILNLTTTNLSVPITAQDGLFQIKKMQANLYQGALNGDFSVDIRTNIPTISFKSQLQNIKIQPFLNDFIKITTFSGDGNIILNMTTKGRNAQDIIQNLNGNMNFSLLNGVFNGLNIPYQIQRATALLQKQPMPSEHSTNSTPFGNLTGTARILNGVINNNDLLIISQFFNGNGLGFIDLPRKKISYTLKVHALNAGDLSQFDIPITINGDLNSPSIGISLEDLVQQVFKQQIKQQIQKQGEQLAQQGKNLLGNLLK